MANTLNLGDGNWGVKDSSLLGYAKDNTKFVPETFDVTRASGGTRVNKSGLIETPTEILSGDLVINGDFATDSDWTKGSGWTISGGKAIASNVSASCFQTSSFVSGKAYKVTYTISDYVSGDFKVQVGSSGFGQTRTSNGTFTEYIDYSGSNFLYIKGSSSFNGSIDNISVVEVNQDNLARIDYTDGADGVLLTEPQSTNLVSDSESYTGYFDNSGTLIYNNITSPDGLQNGAKNYASTTGSFRGLSKSLGSTLNNSEYTLSVFAKAGEFDNLFFYNIGSPSGNGGVWFNLSTGSVGTTHASWSNAKMEDYGNGWYRCSSTVTLSGISDNLYILLADANNSVVATSNGTDGYYIFGAQLEEQSYATSYIPTYGAIATRSGDLVNNAGSVTNFNSEEGVLYFEASSLSQTLTTDGIIRIENSLDDSNEYVDIRYDTTQNRVQIVVRVGGVNQTTSGVVISDTTDNNKFALKYKENDIALWINGVEEITVSSSSVPSGLDELLFSSFYAKTKNIQVFNEALSDAELQTLTTI